MLNVRLLPDLCKHNVSLYPDVYIFFEGDALIKEGVLRIEKPKYYALRAFWEYR